MKKILILLSLASVLSVSSQVQASVLYSDPLTAPPLNAGNLVGQDGWTAHSGAGSVPIQVGASGTTLVHGSGSREDANVALTPISAGQTYYFGFDVVVTGGNANAYFAHFKDVATDFTVRTFVTPSTNGGDFTFGLSPAGSAPDQTWATGLTFGQTYRVVGAYSADTRLNRLWVDPASEESTSLSVIDSAAAAVAAFALRQAGGNSTQLVSNLSVGTTWDSVVPNPGTNPPVVLSFDPVSGAAGTSVTIGGSNFTGATNVAFSGVAATFSNLTDTSISASVPVGALTGPISVSTPDGVGSSTNNFFVPTVAVVLPASINEGADATGELRLNIEATEDITVELASSSTNDLTVETPVTIFAGTTNTFFNISAPLDNTLDSNTNVTVTPFAAGFAGVGATISVVNIEAIKIPLTTFAANSYVQNFDALGTATISNVISGTLGAQTSLGDVVNTNLNGWYGAKIGGGGAAVNIVADNGTGTSGALYNYGSTNSPDNLDRSLGGLSSGTMVPGFGALVQNNTGSTINSIIINLTGKFWRSSTSVQNVLTFGYGLVDGSTFNNINFLSTPGASALPSANVVGPAPVADPNGALDGNSPSNQISISNVAIPVQLLPGETMFFRWQDSDNSGFDAGLAIDDLSLTASVNFAPPVVGAAAVDLFSISESQASVSSSVVSDSGVLLTERGFVYSESLLNTNPVIGGPNVTVITNSPAEIGSYTNLISGLSVSTAYVLKSYAIGSGGTNYSAGTAFNTLAPNPSFTGVYTQSFNGLTNTDFPEGWRCLSSSNINTYAGDWNATNSVSGGFYGRTNIPGVLGYLHTGATGTLSNRLTLVNNTGGTLTNLFVSYMGEVNLTNNTRFPAWTVVVNGETNASLAYSTGSGSNEFKSAEITGLNITNGGNIVVTWWSDRGLNTIEGSSRLIGMTDVRVATTPFSFPEISVTGSLSSFATAAGSPSAAQSFSASGANLTGNITVTAPTDYEVSLDNTAFSSSVALPQVSGTVVSTPVYVRIAATAPVGNPAGQVTLTSTGATPQNIAVTGTVASATSGFTTWAQGAPTNSTTVGIYAIGGATSPTATDGVPSQTTLTSNNLSITAIVRTNDPNLTVFGQSTRNLSLGPWITNGVSKANATDQSNVPSGTARQVFSIERGTNTSLFLRIDSILQP